MEDHERKETRDLLVPLTSEEFLDRARQHAGIDEELDKLDSERKSMLEDIKNRKGAILARKSKLSLAVRTGEEEREVDCEWQENFKQKCWQLVRLDNKKIVDTIAMTAEDLQGGLNVGERKPDPKGRAKKGGKKKGKDAAAGEAAEKDDVVAGKGKEKGGKKKGSRKKGKADDGK